MAKQVQVKKSKQPPQKKSIKKWIVGGIVAVAIAGAVSLDNILNPPTFNQAVRSEYVRGEYFNAVAKKIGIPDSVEGIEYITREEFKNRFPKLSSPARTIMHTVSNKFGLGNNSKSVIYVLDDVFNWGVCESEEEVSILLEHEFAHAITIAKGIKYADGTLVTSANFYVGKNVDGKNLMNRSAIKAVGEMYSYKVQLESSRINKISMRLVKSIKEEYVNQFATFLVSKDNLDPNFNKKTIAYFKAEWLIDDKILYRKKGSNNTFMNINNKEYDLGD